MSQETPASPTEARIKTKRRISPFWLLPVIALLIASWLIWTSYNDRGTTITIDFQSAGIVRGARLSAIRGRGGHRREYLAEQRSEQN
jgi:paraquat-inducible protein B